MGSLLLKEFQNHDFEPHRFSVEEKIWSIRLGDVCAGHAAKKMIIDQDFLSPLSF